MDIITGLIILGLGFLLAHLFHMAETKEREATLARTMIAAKHALEGEARAIALLIPIEEARAQAACERDRLQQLYEQALAPKGDPK